MGLEQGQQVEHLECFTPSAHKIFQMFGLQVSKRARNESDSEDEEPYRPRRQTLEVRLEGGSQVQDANEPQVTGVDASDMPIAHENPSEAQKRYQNLPPVRKLDWQLDDKAKPMRKPLRDSMALTAAFAHTRGTEVPLPCSYCKDGKGVWRSCVVGFDTNESSKLHGVCANCRYSRRYNCDIREHHIGDTTDASFLSEKLSSASSTDSFKAEGSRKRLKRRSTSVSQAKPIIQSKTPPVPLKDGSQNQPSLDQLVTKNSPLDGRVIPFPLGPETIDNLSLLKQAVEDLTGHLDTINRRIQQLEDRERRAMNPWELV